MFYLLFPFIQYLPKIPAQSEVDLIFDTSYPDIQPYLFRVILIQHNGKLLLECVILEQCLYFTYSGQSFNYFATIYYLSGKDSSSNFSRNFGFLITYWNKNKCECGECWDVVVGKSFFTLTFQVMIILQYTNTHPTIIISIVIIVSDQVC